MVNSDPVVHRLIEPESVFADDNAVANVVALDMLLQARVCTS
jgi:hypothetical protein